MSWRFPDIIPEKLPINSFRINLIGSSQLAAIKSNHGESFLSLSGGPTGAVNSTNDWHVCHKHIGSTLTQS